MLRYPFVPGEYDKEDLQPHEGDTISSLRSGRFSDYGTTFLQLCWFSFLKLLPTVDPRTLVSLKSEIYQGSACSSADYLENQIELCLAGPMPPSSPTSNQRHTTNGATGMTTPSTVLIELFGMPGMDKVIRASAFDVLFALFS